MYDSKRKKKEKICLIIACLLSLMLTVEIMNRRMEVVHAQMNETQKALSKEVFRFHVIADNDSEKDQLVKLKVRDCVLKYMKTHMKDKNDAKAVKAWVKAHKKELEKAANRELEKEGVTYHAKAEVTRCYFPDKWYGDVCFPEGTYEALRLQLGRGNGHNWWCVLYPSLCFTNATCAVVDQDGKQELKETLSAEEYEMVTATSEFKIRWFFFGDLDKKGEKEKIKESDK